MIGFKGLLKLLGYELQLPLLMWTALKKTEIHRGQKHAWIQDLLRNQVIEVSLSQRNTDGAKVRNLLLGSEKRKRQMEYECFDRHSTLSIATF